MYAITEVVIQTLSLNELFRLRDAINIMMDLDVAEMDVDVRNLVKDMIQKRVALEKGGTNV